MDFSAGLHHCLHRGGTGIERYSDSDIHLDTIYFKWNFVNGRNPALLLADTTKEETSWKT